MLLRLRLCWLCFSYTSLSSFTHTFRVLCVCIVIFPGALPVHDGLWQSATDTSHSLKHRLAIEHMVHGMSPSPSPLSFLLISFTPHLHLPMSLYMYSPLRTSLLSPSSLPFLHTQRDAVLIFFPRQFKSLKEVVTRRVQNSCWKSTKMKSHMSVLVFDGLSLSVRKKVLRMWLVSFTE